jgi:hypothetical protein
MPQRTLGIAVTFVVAFFLLVLYVAGYLLCPMEERAIGYDRYVYVRWLATLYAPAAKIEAFDYGNTRQSSLPRRIRCASSQSKAGRNTKVVTASVSSFDTDFAVAQLAMVSSAEAANAQLPSLPRTDT